MSVARLPLTASPPQAARQVSAVFVFFVRFVVHALGKPVAERSTYRRDRRANNSKSSVAGWPPWN